VGQSFILLRLIWDLGNWEIVEYVISIDHKALNTNRHGRHYEEVKMADTPMKHGVY